MEATIELDGVPIDVALARKGAQWVVRIGDEDLPAALERNGSGVLVRIDGRTIHVELGAPGQARIDGRTVAYRVASVTGSATASDRAHAHVAHIRPPMNGKLERILVQAGQTVAKGDVLFVLEAMKMQNEVRAAAAGRVVAVHLQAGATVEPRQVVLDLEPV